jgi:hypothetical protein
MPLMVLYEIGIAISRRIMKQQEAEQAERDKPVKRKKKKAPAEEPVTEKKEETAEEPVSDKEEEPAEESETSEEVSTKKPWKRPASKPDPEEGDASDQDDSEPENDKTD